MKMRIITIAAPIVFALALQACTNTQPAYYGTYPSDFAFGPNHGYEPYAAAPYDPYGAYYQNFAPATPYYYEPPESYRDCDDRPCFAYRRNADVEALGPKIIALPTKKEPFNPPSTISRSTHASSATSVRRSPEDRE
jgi:hypothetical protein